MPPKTLAQKNKESKATDLDENQENHFDNIDNGDYNAGPVENLEPVIQEDGQLRIPGTGEGETKEGGTIKLPGKTRERRKAATLDEMRQLARLMSYEDRAAVILAIREDMRVDIQKEQEQEEKAAQEKADKLARLSALKGGL